MIYHEKSNSKQQYHQADMVGENSNKYHEADMIGLAVHLGIGIVTSKLLPLAAERSLLEEPAVTIFIFSSLN